jgi:hypothetical protein
VREADREIVMGKVRIDLENCYGIKKLLHEFDFSKERVYAIYAPNGMMKSSLAQVFQDLSAGIQSSDRIFTARTTKRNIVDETGAEVAKESVFAVRPYDEELSHNEKTSTLLVEPKLRKEYEQLHLAIDKAKDALLKGLKEQSHSKKDLEKEISLAFTTTDKEFQTALTRVKKEIEDQKDTPFADVLYDKIFDDKVLSALETKDLKTAIEEYVKRYNELLAASTYFKRGTFDYYNAGQIAKSLADNGFFAANHTVNLNSKTKIEIKTQKELEDVIAKEKDSILKDKDLRKKFDEIAKLLEKNATLRDFQNYMLEHDALLSQLSNIKKFKEDIWKSYLKARQDLYLDLMKQYEAADKRKKEIEEIAAQQRTQWEDVIQSFNERFVVPFELRAENRIEVMLGHASLIQLGFTYLDGKEQMPIDKPSLLSVLSTGERKALYVLNILFEVETRKKSNQKTLLLIDDIADSFDYQNKYAIVQYLKEISHFPLFNQIIMTHNFDFFRTVESRFVNYGCCLMASKNEAGILSLEKATGIKNAFLNDLKTNFFHSTRKKVASIPFIRNIVEFTKGDSDPHFAKLTALLHWKAESPSIREVDLDGIYTDIFGTAGKSTNGARPMVDVIRDEATACLKASSGINFENKVVLSIAIRIDAEKYMVNRINDPSFVGNIRSHQTQTLVEKFKELFSNETDAIQVLDRVALMTPENIHLNSFMYEPIVDMSDAHLRRLYMDVLDLEQHSAAHQPPDH